MPTSVDHPHVIDIGANLTDAAFAFDLDSVIERAASAGVDRIIVTGTNVESSRAAVELCARYAPRLRCTVGVHPHDAANVGSHWLDELRQLARSPFVSAIGEAGLDFNRNFSPHDAQHAVFDAQLSLAEQLSLPVFVHDRDTGEAVAEHLERHKDLCNVVVHCFTGDARQLQRYLERGSHIGITGWVCDERRGRQLQTLVPHIPDVRLLIETDAPYLLPRTIAPRPKSRRNEPSNLPWVAHAVATLRGQSVEHVHDVTANNAMRVFGFA